MSKLSPFFSDGGALRNKLNFSLTVVCLIIVATLWNTSSVSGAPAKLDSLESPFPLDLQPPVFEAASSSTTSNQGDSGNGHTIDSYGTPIESLQPIETPDGRKVVSAQGLQFEIPNYASGITELKKPADDLLPPFVGELIRNDNTTARIIEGLHNVNDDKQGSDDYADNWAINLATTEQHLSRQVIDDSQPSKLRIERQTIQQNYHVNTDTNNNFNSNTPLEQQKQDEVLKPQTNEVLKPQTNLNTNTFVANTLSTNKPNQFDQQQQQKLTTPTTPYSTLSSSVTNSLSLFVSKQINKPKSLNLNSPLISSPTSTAPSSLSSPTPYSPLQINNSLKSLSSKPKLSAQYAPISNGNFNYPNIPTDLSIIERLASKYKNPLPTIDPIVVALPDDTHQDSFTTNSGPPSSPSSAETTTVDVESVPIVEVKTDSTTAQSSKNPQFLSADGVFQGLPSYILELNDPDIAGPVDYVPDNKGLKVIAWDLLPPFETDAEKEDSQIITEENSTPRATKGVEDPISPNIKVTLSSGHQSGHQPQTTTQEQVSVVDLQDQLQTSQPQLGSRFSSAETTTTKPNYFQQNRGSVHYSSTTPRPTTTTTRRTTTTTTLRTTATPRTTKTTTPRSTTTKWTTTPRTTSTTTTAEPDTSEYFKLEAGDSYTLPTWLQDIDDPELDVAVAYIVPEDINQYNHTLSRDILPPFEPYTDLNNLHLTSPSTASEKYTTSTTTTRTTTLRTTTTPRSTTTTPRSTTTARPKTTTTSTTKRPALSTSQAHWVRAKPTTKSPSTYNNQFLTNHNQDSNNHNVPFTQSSNFAQRTTSTTTIKPKTTVNYYNRPTSNLPKTDKIGGSEETETAPKQQNPFLPTYNNGAYRPQTTTRRTTTTATTTTTAAPDVDVNPFEPTIPPWLKDFDYADVGPGVPFVYDPTEEELAVDKDILPPSETSSETSSETNIKPTFVKSPSSTSSTSSSSFLFNSQTTQGFTNNLSTSATSLTSSSSSIPSKVTIPLPSIPQQQQPEQTNQDQDSTVTQPPLVFVPPPPTAAEDDIVNAKKTSSSSSFNTNFAAPFDPTTNAVTTDSDDSKKIPLGADRESFPPFNNVVTASDGTGSVTLPSKTIFSKSEDGKVITNNVFLNGGTVGGGATSVKPFATSNGGNNQQKATTAATSFNQFGTTAAGEAATSSFGSTSLGASSNGGSKYTGRFGGPPGVLAPQGSGFTTAKPVTKPATYNGPATTAVGFASPTSASQPSNNDKFTGSFGGPPGVFKPYDTVKN